MQYVLDHWSNYKIWRINVCEDSEKTLPDVYPTEQQYTLQRLQVEVDQFFLRAVQQIMAAHRYLQTAEYNTVPLCVAEKALKVTLETLYSHLPAMVPYST